MRSQVRVIYTRKKLEDKKKQGIRKDILLSIKDT